MRIFCEASRYCNVKSGPESPMPFFSSHPSRPSLLEWVVLILMARLAGELPAMVTCPARYAAPRFVSPT